MATPVGTRARAFDRYFHEKVDLSKRHHDNLIFELIEDWNANLVEVKIRSIPNLRLIMVFEFDDDHSRIFVEKLHHSFNPDLSFNMVSPDPDIRNPF